jgi:hypothetical protein
MQERKTVTKAMANQYRRAPKKTKGRILDEFVEATGYNRVYAARVLRGHGKRVEVSPQVMLEGSARVRKKRRPGDRVYGDDVLKALKKVWKCMDYICGKRLVPVLPEVVPRLVSCGELRASRKVQAKLATISAATVDRLLEPERKKFALKGRSGTKPGTLLKHKIPVRTFADWQDTQPGFLEMDLVGHDGGSTAGEYCQTLDVTDVATGWSEQLAVPTKAQCWVFEAIQEMRNRLPFALRGLDSDNGGEFINNQLLKYCEAEQITFTRSRASKKNDNCYVEQKNWSIVRRHVGYARYQGEAACQCLNDLYLVLHDYVNFFMPSMKLVEKVRDGARVRKRYDQAQTPYQRVLACPQTDPAVKRRLKARYAQLNLAALHREILRLQKHLVKHTVRVTGETSIRPKPAANHPWRQTKSKKKAG